MKINDDILRLGIIGLCLVILYLFIFTPIGLNKQGRLFFENLVINTAYKLFYEHEKQDDIVIVTVDDKSISSGGLRWPWPRRRFAEFINKIRHSNPSVIAFDIAFVGSSSYGEDDDAILTEAIKDAGNVVLVYFTDADGEDIFPLKSIGDSAKAVGFVNKIKDDFNMVRYARAVSLKNGRFDYCFETKAAALYKDMPLESLSVAGRNMVMGKYSVPLRYDGTFPIKYTRKENNFTTISVEDVFGDNYSEGLFKEKIVLFGLTAISLHDIHFTPFGSMPGVLINANEISNLLTASHMGQIQPAVAFIIYVLLSLICAYAGYRYNTIFSVSIVSVLTLIFYGFSVYLYKLNILVDFFGAVFIMYIMWAVAQLYLYLKLQVHKLKMINSLTMDEKTGLYNLYYLLIETQRCIDNAKMPKEFPSIILLRFTVPADKDSRSANKLDNRIIIHASSMVKDIVNPFGGIVAKASDFELGIIIPKIEKDKLIHLVDDIYTHLNGREIIHSDNRSKYTIYPVVGACCGADVSKKSARLLLSMSEKMADKAVALKNRHVYLYDEKEGRISLLADESEELIDKSKLMNFVLDDLKRRNKHFADEVNTLKLRIEELVNSHFTIILSLVKALEEKDIYTAGHSNRVADYSEKIAKKIGLDKDAVDMIKKAALLHDIGKIGIPDFILHKKEDLSSDERSAIQKHPIESVKILEPAIFLKNILPLILHHHERYDGKGYPHGLSGERIPLGARIIAIADSFDAMTSGRGYNKPKNTLQTIDILKQEAGGQFDPGLIPGFIEIISQQADEGYLR